MFMQANALVGATEGNLQEAMKLSDRAIQLDLRFARALSSRANTRLTFLTMSLPVPCGVDAAERREAGARDRPGFRRSSRGARRRSHSPCAMERSRCGIPARAGEGTERPFHPDQSLEFSRLGG